MMWGYGPFGDVGWGWHFIPMALWWVILLLLVLLLARRVFRGPSRYWHGGDRALHVLRERYAKGEIDKDQFERMKADLNG